ncbi:hypothetical protein [uncultured Lamprocystis sp.]|jgi:hypothetical protein|uniref:hypothetical protein n=1 Tax=uncultured Lamprocystis sp. TaxID=543132 RepID=UPI0025D2666E|nr:hypothetical protein [uncultured Lamprocystis sp.]
MIPRRVRSTHPRRLPFGGLGCTLLLIWTGTAATTLRDSGYGDGSLVDRDGNYYYPQPDGSFMDPYGASYHPLGDGVYADAIGNRIEAASSPEALPADQLRDAYGAPARVETSAPDVGAWSSNQGDGPAPARPGTLPGDRADHAGNAVFGSMYLEDAGDGYLEITPEATVADPRLAPAPPSSPNPARDQPAGRD